MHTSGATITHDRLPTIEANAHQLQLVFHELLDNTLKFHNSAPPRIHVWATRQERSWCFAVRDNGIGIDPQFYGKLFGFFKRLHHRRYEGTGMGLAICKKIVERHGGKIWIEPTPGGGTTLFFTIGDTLSQ
jgi:chemotaxis family two-component system sensor kinase Cph1